MKRMATVAAAVAVVAVVVASDAGAARRLRIPAGHRNDAPKTLADQQKQNAATQSKLQGDQQQQQPAAPQQRPTTGPSAALAKAQGTLDRVEKRLREQFEKGEDYVKAAAALKAAQDSYDGAHKNLVTKLGDDPAYAAAVKEQEGAEAELAAARKEGKADQTAALAGKVMEAKKVVHQQEAEAAEKDDGVKEAKAKVAEAKGKVDELRKGFEEKMKEDPDYVAAVHAVEEAKGTKA